MNRATSEHLGDMPDGLVGGRYVGGMNIPPDPWPINC